MSRKNGSVLTLDLNRSARSDRGMLEIERDGFELAIRPLATLTLSQAQIATGSTSPSSIRQARRLAGAAFYSGAIRTVVAPASTIGLALDRGDCTTLCMEASLPAATKPSLDDAESVKDLINEVLESRLTGSNPGQSEVVEAFRASVIMAEGWLSLGVALTADELSCAEMNREPKVRTWTCNNPR